MKTIKILPYLLAFVILISSCKKTDTQTFGSASSSFPTKTVRINYNYPMQVPNDTIICFYNYDSIQRITSIQYQFHTFSDTSYTTTFKYTGSSNNVNEEITSIVTRNGSKPVVIHYYVYNYLNYQLKDSTVDLTTNTNTVKSYYSSNGANIDYNSYLDSSGVDGVVVDSFFHSNGNLSRLSQGVYRLKNDSLLPGTYYYVNDVYTYSNYLSPFVNVKGGKEFALSFGGVDFLNRNLPATESLVFINQPPSPNESGFSDFSYVFDDKGRLTQMNERQISGDTDLAVDIDYTINVYY